MWAFLAFLAAGLAADDRELLRKDGADPYLFILLDSSMSMSLAIDGSFVEAGDSDPRSRIYQAKKVLYELLKDLDGIRFGFASLNRDQLRVRSKHWLYYIEDPTIQPGNAAGLSSLKSVLGYPEAEPGNQIEVPELDGEGTPTGDVDVVIDGDLMTFGRGLGDPEFSIKAGSCSSPLRIGKSEDRDRINRFSKLGVDSKTDTEIWVEADIPGDDPTYRLTFRNADPGTLLGSATIDVTIVAEKVRSCNHGAPIFDVPIEHTLTFRKWREFLMAEDLPSTAESTPGLWNWRDADGIFSCGETKSFSGGGWEGNYDTGEPFTTNPAFESTVIPSARSTLVDTHCAVASDSASCELLQLTTSYETVLHQRELDRGDVLPFHWNLDHRDAMLARLNPNHLVDKAHPRYGVAYYFEDTPDASGRLRLKTAYRDALSNTPLYPPIPPAGISPVSDAILDFRCWYTGSGDEGPDGVCGRSGLGGIYTRGFMKLLEENDPAAFPCRQPFLLVISDMESNCPGEAPIAEVAGMNSATRTEENRASGISTWLLNVGSGQVTGLADAGKGGEIKVDTSEELRGALIEILGTLRESTQSYAAAAVPSAQKSVDDKIYITRFTPRQEAAVWEGHVHAFLRPLPTAEVDPGHPEAGMRPDPARALWDGAETLLGQAPDASTVSVPLDRNELRIGPAPSQRRYFYSIRDTDPTRDTDGDSIPDNDEDTKVPKTRSYFGPVSGPAPPGMDQNDVRKDLWVGLGILDETFRFTSHPDGSDLFAVHNAEASAAHAVFEKTYTVKVVEPRDDAGNPAGKAVEYVLGDTFHATPLLVGSPRNGRYLARSAVGEPFEGYGEFFKVQARRRRVLFVASNDGQLHAFDAGRFERDASGAMGSPVSIEGGRFSNGTGVELFAFTPRGVLPTLTSLTTPPLRHRWGIDATPVAADVRIDPVHDGRGSANPPAAAQREWRTVIVGGLRRGGRSYYALDITHPDKMVEEIKTLDGKSFSLGFKPEAPTDVVPGCLSARGRAGDPGDCDPTGLDYPAILWEFADPDLGETWSEPDLGAIRVLKNGREAIKYVAVFAGGMDPGGLLNEADHPKGGMLYIVDIETGKMLYKRDLEGAAPAGPAVIDTDQDGFLDRIYIGTTEGLMYRVNLDPPRPIEFGASCVPGNTPLERCCLDPEAGTNGCVIHRDWEPYPVFDTGTEETDAAGASRFVRRPIFFPPAVMFVSRWNAYALGFGTGNRENLWSPAPLGGNRFYLFLDDTDVLERAAVPRDELDLTEVTHPLGIPRDLLNEPLEGERGWFIKLGQISASDASLRVSDEKMLAPTTAIAGINAFSTFIPNVTTSVVGSGGDRELRCSRRGISRVYTQLTSSGDPVCVGEGCDDPIHPDAPPDPLRRPREVPGLLSLPFPQQSSKPCLGTQRMSEILKDQLFPPGCRFANYGWSVSSIRSDTAIECLAYVPVCMVEKSWRDF